MKVQEPQTQPEATSTRPAIAAPGPLSRLPMYAAWIGYGSLLVSIVAMVLRLPSQAGSVPAYITRQDFVGLYLGARFVATGQSAHLYDLAAQYQMQYDLMTPYAPLVHTLYFTYPAWNAVLFAPLGALDYPTAFWIFAAANALMAGYAIYRLVWSTGTSRSERGILLLVAAGFTPFWYTLWQGQTSIIVCLGLVGAVLAFRSGTERRAGAWFALGLVKPQLIATPALGLVTGRRWRALAVFMAAAAGLVAISLAVLGDWITPYIRLLTQYVGVGATAGDDVRIMHNWRAMVFRLFGDDTGVLASGLVIALTLASLGLAAYICRSRGGKAADWAPGWGVRWSVAVLLGLLADPHLYLQDALIAIVPGFVLWRASAGGSQWWSIRVLRGVLAAGPFVARLALSWAPPVVEIGSWYLVTLLLSVLWAWPALTSLSKPEGVTGPSPSGVSGVSPDLANGAGPSGRAWG